MEAYILKQHYEKEINRQIDIIRRIDCVNLSIGANNIEDFAWIENNIELFRQRSIEIYNKIISSIMQQIQMRLYFIIYEEKDFEFTAVERHLGIWHKFKNIPTYKNSKDIYLSNKLRYAYVELDSLSIEQFSILQYGNLVFLENELKISECLEGLIEGKSVFDRFYTKGYLMANFREFWAEGNALVFYSMNKHYLDEITDVAYHKENFAKNSKFYQ